MGTFNLFIARFIVILDTEQFLLSINKDYNKNMTTLLQQQNGIKN